MKIKLVIVGVFGILALAGCGEYGQNATKGSRDTGSADIINFPQGFRNVAHKCDGPNMVYSSSYGDSSTVTSSITVIGNDPRCKQ